MQFYTALYYAIICIIPCCTVRYYTDCYREGTEIGPPAISVPSRYQSGQNLARKADFRSGSTVA